jgi:hypothetical protein
LCQRYCLTFSPSDKYSKSELDKQSIQLKNERFNLKVGNTVTIYILKQQHIYKYLDLDIYTRISMYIYVYIYRSLFPGISI